MKIEAHYRLVADAVDSLKAQIENQKKTIERLQAIAEQQKGKPGSSQADLNVAKARETLAEIQKKLKDANAQKKEMK